MKNLIKNNLKQKTWLIGCLSLIFVLCRPMMQLLTYENTKNYTILNEDLISVMEGFFLPDIFTDYIPTALACVVIGLVFFSYLFSKKKVDLYHSIPIDRKHMFIANYVSGIIIYAFALFLEYMLCILIAIPSHYMTLNAAKNIAFAIICNMVHFLYGYGVILCAVMLTGNIVVAIVASAVLGLFFPVVTSMVTYLERYFFVTYIGSSLFSPDIITKGYWLSPITSYATVIQRSKYDWYPLYFESVYDSYISLILPFIMTVVVSVIAYFLYINRLSEAAGKSIAFKKSRSIIEIPISVLGGLLGLWFMGITVTSYKSVWIWVGVVLGTLLSHCILEIIINESFKAFASHKLQLICTIAISVIIVGIYYGDLTNYDKYLPNRENVKTAGIYFNGIDNGLSYTEVSEDKNNPGYYVTKYNSGMDYAFEHRFDDQMLIDRIIGVANIGITCVDDMIEDKKNNGSDFYEEAIYDKMAYEEDFSDSGDDALNGINEEEAYEQAREWMEENGYHEVSSSDERKILIDICYELNNGRVIVREYNIPISKVLPAINDIYNSEEFNKCHFDIYKGYNDGVISKVEVYDNYESKVVSVTEQEKDLLMDTYISELKEIKLDTISMAPVGRIVPSYKVSAIYDDSYSGYYIYPDFKKTLALIESYGADVSGLTADVKAEDIVSINVSSYNLYERDDQDFAYVSDIIYDMENDEEFINELSKKLINANNIWSNELLVNNTLNCDRVGADITVYITPDNGIQRAFSARFSDGELPEKIKKDIAIKLWMDNQY